MNKKVKTVIGILVFAVIIGGAWFAYRNLGQKNLPDNSKQPAGTNEELKIAAPDFTVYDADGNAVSLSDFSGKPTIINFWATWCPYCIEEMPSFDESYKKYGDRINFVMIDCVDGRRETKEKAEQFIKDKGFTFPVYYDTDQTAVASYGASSLPTSVFIDKDGYVVAYQPGMLTPEMLQMGIGLIYDETE